MKPLQLQPHVFPCHSRRELRFVGAGTTPSGLESDLYLLSIVILSSGGVSGERSLFVGVQAKDLLFV
jgi:hypothetical protein